MSVFITVLLIAAALAAVFVFGGPWLMYRLTVDRRKPLIPIIPRGGESRPCWIDTKNPQTVSIQSEDGLTLKALYLAFPGMPGTPRKTAILAHGYRGNARQTDAYAKFFYEELGFSVLLPDARSHGASEGRYIGFGWPERLDYLKWIDWVRSGAGEAGTPPAGSECPDILLFGVSMGAATVMMTSGEALPAEVKAVVEDCGYTSVEDEIRYQLRELYHIRLDWFFRAGSRIVKKRAGYGFEEASALDQVKKTKVPILFIHGEADSFVPFEMVHALYNACPGEKELFTVKDAIHGGAYETAPAEYEGRIRNFVSNYFINRG
jgi:fermentation-respiration switch protein FrsA (DUF1100 family)